MISYVPRLHGVIWMLTMYSNNAWENIPAHVLLQIREALKNGEVKAKDRA